MALREAIISPRSPLTLSQPGCLVSKNQGGGALSPP